MVAIHNDHQVEFITLGLLEIRENQRLLNGAKLSMQCWELQSSCELIHLANGIARERDTAAIARSRGQVILGERPSVSQLRFEGVRSEDQRLVRGPVCKLGVENLQIGTLEHVLIEICKEDFVRCSKDLSAVAVISSDPSPRCQIDSSFPE